MSYAKSDVSPSAYTSNIVVQQIQGPTVTQTLTKKAGSSWSWYITRGSGMVAAITLFLLILAGIGQVTGYTFKFLDPLTAWASHRALGITFGVAVLIHIFSLLFDHFIPFNLSQILIPWASSYKPVTLFGHQLGSLYVALGVIAFYLTAIVIITSLVWVDKKPYTWKLIHLLSYLIIFFVYIHALFLGTDLAHGTIRIIWLALGVGMGVAFLHRLWRAKTI